MVAFVAISRAAFHCIPKEGDDSIPNRSIYCLYGQQKNSNNVSSNVSSNVSNNVSNTAVTTSLAN